MYSIADGVISGVGQTFLVASLGLLGRLLGVISEETMRHLTRVAIVLLLPCFLFEAVLRDFTWERLHEYQFVIFIALGFLAVGLALAWLGARALGLTPRDRHTGMALSGFNNSLNIPIPLALALLPEDQSGKVIVLFTIYNLVWSPFIWSLGVWLISSRGGGKGWWKAVITPPGMAIIAAIIAKTPGISGVVESPRLAILHQSLEWAGQAAIPISLLVLGGILGGLLRRVSIDWRVVGLVTTIKLFAIPALTWVLLRLMPGLDALLALALMIQAASPPATNLVIIAEHYGGDTDTVGTALTVTYALSMATYVLWLGIL